ncbi:hypothetical protein PQO03_08095 [Lentisphaera profundi]|uniref:Cell division protein FtsL n=1 Tax=Lentisphaera profundi TaxID=1658616 RepID=A0ABY7VR32_9BACT|nr:hypothetical protein [Lentisphaera profundi]WDE95678.1 hypothetical protein PQO03_08095 [Lentisphaera profundi]
MKNNKDAKRGGSWILIFDALLVLVLALGYLYMETHQDKIQSELSLQKKLLHEAQVRRINLKAQLEEKTQSSYIFRKVREYKLNLHSPNPSYVMELYHIQAPLDDVGKQLGSEGQLAVTTVQP